MRTLAARVRAFYGANPLHLLALLACFALVGYVIAVIGPTSLWDPHVWWQSILVWFLGAVIAHDLVLFPLYALADHSLTGLVEAVAGRRDTPPRVPVLNYIRVPGLATGIVLLIYFPGILKQGANSYLRATGQNQDPFLQRFLLLTAVFFAISAIAYSIRTARTPDTPR